MTTAFDICSLKFSVYIFAIYFGALFVILIKVLNLNIYCFCVTLGGQTMDLDLTSSVPGLLPAVLKGLYVVKKKDGSLNQPCARQEHFLMYMLFGSNVCASFLGLYFFYQNRICLDKWDYIQIRHCAFQPGDFECVKALWRFYQKKTDQ